jgi:hypothetical protein
MDLSPTADLRAAITDSGHLGRSMTIMLSASCVVFLDVTDGASEVK